MKYATGGDDLRTAKNAADGTVTFDDLHYTTEMLEGLVKDGNASKNSDKSITSWTVSYLAYEKTDGLAGQGITAQTQPIPFTVTVVDYGNGELGQGPEVREHVLHGRSGAGGPVRREDAAGGTGA